MTEGRLAAGNWREDGWALYAGVLGADEIAGLLAEADRLLAMPDLFAERGAVVNSQRRSDRLDPVIDLSPAFAAVARDRGLLALASELLGGEAQLFKDKFIAKPPGAIGYAAHQDGAYWPGMGLDPGRFLTAVLFLDPAGEDNGAIECASGSHRKLLTDPARIADLDEDAIGPFHTVEAAAGDLLMIHALTPHRSASNRSQRMRRALLFTYGVDPRLDLYAVYRQHRTRISE